MIKKTLAELQQPDDASLLFSPYGAGAQMWPEDAADFHQQLIARHVLSSQVPESTRMSFERVLTIYSYGILCYELYTVAGDYARLVVEQALRDRFLPFYADKVEFVDAQGNPQVVATTEFNVLYNAIRRDDGRLQGWKLKLASDRKPITFNGEFSSLLRWARAEGILGGQRDRVRDDPRVKLRNFAAHPSYHLGTPFDAEEDIADLARIINGLWGAPFEASATREVMAVGWDDRTVTWARAETFNCGRLSGEAVVVLVRADPADRSGLASYDARYETTAHPCDYLWGPGPWEDAQAWLERDRPAEDEVIILDRLFVLRYHDRRLHLPQSLPVAAGLPEDYRSGMWYLIRADNPADAFGHQRQVLAEVAGHTPIGHCRCPVETIGKGDWDQVLKLAAAAGVDVTPQPVPDVRVSISRIPRYNEITGPGSWSSPSRKSRR